MVKITKGKKEKINKFVGVEYLHCKMAHLFHLMVTIYWEKHLFYQCIEEKWQIKLIIRRIFLWGHLTPILAS